MIRAEQLTYGFADKDLYKNVSFILPDNRHCVLIGSNGSGKTTLVDLIRRPQVKYADLAPVDPTRPAMDPLVAEQLEIELKYEGYIRREQAQIDEMRRLESRLLPPDTPYDRIHGLRKEAQEKLARVRPHSIGQASRISGVSPADVSVLIVWSSQNRKEN